MKALSFTQPWATLIAIGAKTIETRSWRSSYRGRIAIHAAKSMPPEAREFAYADPAGKWLNDAGYLLGSDCKELPRQEIIASARLVDCIPTEDALVKLDLDDDAKAFGDYSPDRYAFILEDVRPIPVPLGVTGALGLWEYEGGGICRVCGCSQFDGCDGSCGWYKIDLCTDCIGVEEGIFV